MQDETFDKLLPFFVGLGIAAYLLSFKHDFALKRISKRVRELESTEFKLTKESK